ncbi:5-carboxymethyl-2-hydroxymuconate Delta-isomerase [Dongshaea marina]|uniref:5-carboxymethyl-2-hydroxymuconate Delta-isomerase n=1 Tax=Dongshaea marina TaxID=2047966 RepID=UPI000D3EA7BB|nr:5-carboxymethyl-2-hydroxymuconate Delta-isomerase [Dongshaea marina]
MPHCIIEYSKPIEEHVAIEQLVERVHSSAFDSGLFRESDIKTRAIGYEHFKLGEEHNNFIHLSVKILPGRTDEQKAMLADGVLNALGSLAMTDLALSVEVVDLPGDSYIKCNL